MITKEMILKKLAKKSHSIPELAEHFGVHCNSIKRRITELQMDDKIDEDPRRSGSRLTYYKLHSRGRKAKGLKYWIERCAVLTENSESLVRKLYFE